MPTVLDNIAPIGHDRLEQVYGEVPVERVKPPHHLLETQIFSHLQKNDIFQVEPEQLSFLVNKSVKPKKVKVINSSGARQNFHVIEPINQNRWQISYIKPDGGLVPGGHVEIQVKFITPTKAERSGEKGTIYQDSIRLHCSGGNLVIPLYAYPTIDSKDFPSKINFGSVPLGHENHRTITLNADSEESFEFCCSMSPSSRAFSVSPWSGTITGETHITISYCPTEFVTSSSILQIIFSTFDRKVLKCQINGNCLPGLLTMKKKREFEIARKMSFNEKAHRENRMWSEVEKEKNLISNIISQTIQKPKAKTTRKIPKPEESEQTEKIKIGAQHHINRILNSKDTKNSKCDVHTQAYSDSATKFRLRLREATEAEKINKLRWQVRIGDDIPEPYDLRNITNNRRYDKIPIDDRTERDALSKPDYSPNFDLYRNSPWRGRHFALVRFQQAARTVLIRIRAEDRLSNLRKLMKLVNSGMTVNAAEATITGSLDETKIFQLCAPPSSAPFVKDFSPSCDLFKQWKINDKFGDEVPEDQLPMENGEKLKPVYHPLVTPVYYEQMGYSSCDSYAWNNKVEDIMPNSNCLVEETSYELELKRWNYEDLDSAINNYNILSGKKEERKVNKGGQRLSRWNSVTQGMNSSSNPKL
jgi:hypothetical protein